MAYTRDPNDYIAGYAYDGTNLTIPRTALHVTTGDVNHELSAADCAAGDGDGVSDTGEGDIAEILMALLNKIYEAYAADDAPTKWSMSRSSSASGTTGNVSFGVSFQTAIATPPTQTVQDEA